MKLGDFFIRNNKGKNGDTSKKISKGIECRTEKFEGFPAILGLLGVIIPVKIDFSYSEEYCFKGVRALKKEISINGRELHCIYSEYFCNRKLIIKEKYVIRIEINEPGFRRKNIVLRNSQSIEEYLLSLNERLKIKDVYEKVMELLGLSDEEISECGKILIAYMKIEDERETTISKIVRSYGQIQEYVFSENDEA